MKHKRDNAVSIIGGADGPTSVFIAGRSGKRPLKVRVKNYIYKCKSNRAKKKISAGTHTLEEVAAYAMERYKAVEVDTSQRKYIEQRGYLKEGLILRYKPELAEEMKDISEPDISNEASVKEFLRQMELRRERIAKIPDSEMPMDYHMYEIKEGDNSLEMEIDYSWNVFQISYTGNFRKISQDLYLYYGVNEVDIKEKTERYSSLLAVLSA